MHFAKSNLVSTGQFYGFILLVIIPTSYLTLPTFVAGKAGNGAWFSPFISMLSGIISVVCIGYLRKASPERDIVQWGVVMFGPMIGRVIGIAFSLFCLISGVIIVLEIVGFLCPMILRTTPLIIVLTAILSAIAFMLYHGLEGIARISGILCIFLYVLTTVFMLGSIRAFHVSTFLPVFNRGWSGVFEGSYVPLGWFGEVAILAMFFPYVSRKRPIQIRSLVLIIVFCAILLSGITTTDIGVLGDPETARSNSPTFEVIKYMQWGPFIQHVDAIFLVHWISAMILKAIIFYQAGILGLYRSCGMSESRLLIIPVLGMSIPLALWFFPNQHSISEFNQYVFPNYSLIFELLFPLMLCIMQFLKSLKHGNAIW
jgi:spore germination protein KB